MRLAGLDQKVCSGSEDVTVPPRGQSAAGVVMKRASKMDANRPMKPGGRVMCRSVVPSYHKIDAGWVSEKQRRSLEPLVYLYILQGQSKNVTPQVKFGSHLQLTS